MASCLGVRILSGSAEEKFRRRVLLVRPLSMTRTASWREEKPRSVAASKAWSRRVLSMGTWSMVLLIL